jgi:sterol desaturase/sphingolipid hydroxylase (fatty acid hydroxylase superfamily)
MLYHNTDLELWQRWLGAYSFLFFRYVLFAGGLYLLFYVVKRKDWFYKKIQQKFPAQKRIWYEIKYSVTTFAIFSLLMLLNYYLTQKGYTKIYKDIDERGWGYFALTVALFIVVHDAYFYWTHRLMHLPGIFERVHKVHHMSNNPTPWAAFSFHPVEAVIEFGIIFVMAFLIPVHSYAILSFALFMMINNVLGHLGYELYPKGFTRNRFTFWLNTSTHHNMHHKMIHCNYGLYFNIWDRICGTNHVRYHETFESVASRNRVQEQQTSEEPAAKKAGLQV